MDFALGLGFDRSTSENSANSYLVHFARIKMAGNTHEPDNARPVTPTNLVRVVTLTVLIQRELRS
jgi:hypothetical protein